MLVRDPRRAAAQRAAFTLTEVLVVLAIIVVLAAMTIPITMGVLQDARNNAARAHISGTLFPAVKRFQIKYNQPPNSLIECVEDTGIGLPPEALIDPWGNEYQYQPPQTASPLDHGTIYSTGANPADQNGWIVVGTGM